MTQLYAGLRANILFVGFVFIISSLSAQFQLNGNATQNGANCYTLTPNLPSQIGTIWSSNLISLDDPFDLYVELNLGCVDANGADGMAFVLQPVSTSVGVSGSGMGYQGITPSLAVQFDTYQNGGDGDPAYDHLALLRNGSIDHNSSDNLSGPVGIFANLANAEDCAFHKVRITWNPTINQLRVFIDCQLRLSYVGNVRATVFNNNSNVYWGFTASTGALSNVHQVCMDYISFFDETVNTALCEGDTVQVAIGSGVSYSWTPTAGVSNPAIQNPLLFPDTTTLYTANVTDACGFVRPFKVTALVQPFPVANAGADTSICLTDTITLHATGGDTYLWDTDPDIADPTSPDPMVSPTTQKYYYVTVTNTIGCSTRDSIQVGINPIPVTTAIASPLTVCSGDTVTLTATGGLTYQWQSTNALISPNTAITRSKLTYAGTSATDTTWFYVTVTDAVGCIAPDSVFAQVWGPTVITAGPDTLICFGDTIQLSATGGVSYVWNFPATLSDDSIANPLSFPLSNTVYTVRGTDINGCKGQDQVTVNVRQLPIANAGSDRDICINDTLALLASGGLRYFWNPDPSLRGDSVRNPIVFPTTQTSYFLRVEDNIGCEDRDTIIITVNPLPNAIASAEPNAICTGDSLTISASGGLTYAWTPANLVPQNTASTSRISLTNVGSTADSIWLFVAVVDTNGCRDRDSVQVIVRPNPPLTVSPPQNICIGDTLKLFAEGGLNYTWTGPVSNRFIANPTAYVTKQTSFYVTTTDVFGCISSDSTFVIVHALPEVNAGPDTAICLGLDLQLQGSGAVSYLWSPAATLSNANSANPVSRSDASIRYVLTGRDNFGCVNKDSVEVEVVPRPVIEGKVTDSVCVGEKARLEVTGSAVAGRVTYLWSTGANTAIISPLFSATTPTWALAYANGCYSDTLRGQVWVAPRQTGLAFTATPLEGYAPLPVQFTNTSSSGVRYFWDFGDGATSDSLSPKHTYIRPGQQTVTLVAYNEIGCADTLSFSYIDVWETTIFVPNAFSPNGDQSNDEFFLAARGIVGISVKIFDRWGTSVFESEDPEFKWDGKSEGNDVPEGVYIVSVRAKDALDRVHEHQGTVTIFR